MSMFPTPLHLSLLALGLLAPAPSLPPAPAVAVTAAVEQCIPSVDQTERSATFAAQMTLIPGAQHMAMQMEVQERSPTESAFHAVAGATPGAWRQSDPGVKIYKFVRQVTNLTAPAAFRAQVRYRWLDGKGHTIRRAQRHTPVCVQPVDIPKAAARMSRP